MESGTSYSSSEITDIHFVYGLCNGNSRAAAREYRNKYPRRRAPNHKTFVDIHRQIAERGVATLSNHHSLRRSAALIEEQVLAEVTRNPESSVRRLSARLGVSKSSVWRILKKEGLHPYHFQKVQHLHSADFTSRAVFCSWIMRKIRSNPENATKIMWTDEAIFTRAGITNFRNLHKWAGENPHLIRPSRFQQQFSVNVWAAIIDDQLIGPFEIPQVMNSLNFLNLMQNNLVDFLEDVPIATRQNMWFQLDGCPAHFGLNVRQYLDSNFPQWIGRGGPVAWPPRSPDLTPLDFFLWGAMKAKVYASIVNSREELLQRIQAVANEIRTTPGVLKRSTQSVGHRAMACIQNHGGHFEQMLN